MPILIALLVTALLCACGCTPQVPVGRAVGQALDGFIFVGEFPGSNGPIPPHGYSSRTTPDRLDVGRRYVFHHVEPIDTAGFAVNVLPVRMRQIGFELLEAPKSLDEMPSVDPGDRAWRVTFRYEGREGEIRNASDLELLERGGLVPGGSTEMLIVTLRR